MFEEALRNQLKIWFNEDTKYDDDFDKMPSFPLLEYPVFLNCHLGQRKLLINEIIFYNTLPKNKPITVVYSGSASGEHTPIILDLFPNLNFIMVDPNFHYMEYDYIMIYKDKYDNLDSIKNLPLVKRRLSNQEFADGTKRNIINNKSYGSLNSFKGFKKSRVYVIQDYMMPELATQLRKIIVGDIYHISDIRTNVSRSYPTDMDYLYNNALQILIIKNMKPKISHLKFRLPNWKTGEYLDQIHPEQLEVLDKCKEYGFNFLEDYKNNIYPYFDGEILIQPWGPPKTMESRLITDGKSIKKYTLEDYRGKFMYISCMRGAAFFPYYYDKVKDLELNYDGCFDCAIEIRTLMDATNTCDEFLNLSLKIDKITRYNINRKCNHHGKLTHRLKEFTYGYEINYNKIYVTIENK